MTLRWGLIGASTIAREWVLPALRACPGHAPVGVFSSSIERGRRFAQEQDLAVAYPTLEAVLADPRVDAVYISTANDRRATEIVAAAEAGKHVLAEKPLALTVDDAQAAVAACEHAGVVLATNHHFRNNLAVRRARDLLAGGAIGRLLAVRVAQAFRLPADLHRWRLSSAAPGAGAILDLAVHDVDTLRFLLDDEVAEVCAFSEAHLGDTPAAEDIALGVLRFRSGVLASFFDAFSTPDGNSTVELYGDEGSIVIEDALDERLIAKLAVHRDGLTEQVDVSGAEDLYVYGLRRFAEAVAGTGCPAASGNDGLSSLAVALAIRRSADSGSVEQV